MTILPHSRRLGRLAQSAAVCVLTASSLSAQTDGDTTPAVDSRLTIHGYLSQAYAKTDGPQLLGIPDDGTTDYRDLALQLRYRISSDDSFIVQFSHERKAKSPAQVLHPDVELDWALYQHRFSDETLMKVGRVPIPMGIYNEIRDVGTLIPFFAPPWTIYNESAFSAETVDGAAIKHEFFSATNWNLGVEAYFGSWAMVQRQADVVAEARAENAYGLQLWLDTPINGLRLGLATQDYDVQDGIVQLNDSDHWSSVLVSLDANFDRFMVRSEFLRRNVTARIFGIPIPDLAVDQYYIQGSVRLTGKLSLNLQYENMQLDPNLPGSQPLEFWDEAAAGVTFAFSPNLVLKAEHHQNTSFFTEDGNNNFLVASAVDTNYDLVSLSVAF